MSRARQQEWLRAAMVGLHDRQQAREVERRQRTRNRYYAARQRVRRQLILVLPWRARFTLRPQDLRLPYADTAD